MRRLTILITTATMLAATGMGGVFWLIDLVGLSFLMFGAALTGFIPLYLASAGRQSLAVIALTLSLNSTLAALSFWLGGGLVEEAWVVPLTIPFLLCRLQNFRLLCGLVTTTTLFSTTSYLCQHFQVFPPPMEIVDGAGRLVHGAVHVLTFALVCVILTVTIRELHRSIRRSKEVVQTLSLAKRVRQKFLTGINHELRLPLNAVMGVSGLLLDSSLRPEQRKHVQVIRYSSESMLDLISRLLDYSTPGVMDKSRAEKFVPAELVESSFGVAIGTGFSRQVELSITLADDLPPLLRADATCIQSVVISLLTNALKFTKQGEVGVDVSVRKSPNQPVLVLAIHDSGPGISPSAGRTIFEPFFQADYSTTREHGGVGLGLSLCKRYVNELSGTMRYETSPSGTTFFVEVPVQVVPTPGEDIPEYMDPNRKPFLGIDILIVDDCVATRRSLSSTVERWGATSWRAATIDEATVLLDTLPKQPFILIDRHIPGFERLGPRSGLITLESPSDLLSEKRGVLVKPVRVGKLFTAIKRLTVGRGKSSIQHAFYRSLRVLVVDDNFNNRKIMALSLEQLGLRADAVADGREAVELAQIIGYDIIFLNLQMPDHNGLRAARAIRALPNGQPFIVVVTPSGVDFEVQADEALSATTWLKKPLTVEKLESTLDACRAWRDSTEDVFDISALNKLVSLTRSGGGLTLQDLLAKLLPSVLRLAEEVCAAAVEEDPKRLRRAAHSLKSSAANVGAIELTALAKSIEAHLTASNFVDAYNEAKACGGAKRRYTEVLESYLGKQELTV